MSEVNMHLKGPAGAIIGGIVIIGFVYYQFFMPFSPSAEDKKAIKEKIEEIRVADMGRIAKTTVDQYKKTGKTRDTSKELKALSGKIKITKIEGKKGSFGRTKIKVTYTLDGKTPKNNGGTLYFSLYRRKQNRRSLRKITELSQITEDDYQK